MSWWVGLNRILLFYVTVGSGFVQNERPSPLPEHGLFLPVFLPGEGGTDYNCVLYLPGIIDDGSGTEGV